MSISLSEDHELQVQGYLRFAKLKREQHVREVTSVINDFKADRIRQGEVYNYRELAQLFGDLEEQAKELVDKEIQNAYHTNALLVKILLSQAQANGLELAVDTNQLENEFLLKQITATESTALSRPASDFVRRNNNLGKIGTVAQISTQDPAVVRERDALKQELQAANERLTKLQEETTKMMRDRSGLNTQINALKDELAAKETALKAAMGDKDSTVSKLQQDMAKLNVAAAGMSKLSTDQADSLQRQAGGLQAQLSAAQDELQAARNQIALKDKEVRAVNEALNGKLQESKQFLSMKQMMQAKSQEVVTLRKRLEKYEPQSVPSAD